MSRDPYAWVDPWALADAADTRAEIADRAFHRAREDALRSIGFDPHIIPDTVKRAFLESLAHGFVAEVGGKIAVEAAEAARIEFSRSHMDGSLSTSLVLINPFRVMIRYSIRDLELAMRR